jgi:hypothetical protein
MKWVSLEDGEVEWGGLLLEVSQCLVIRGEVLPQD